MAEDTSLSAYLISERNNGGLCFCKEADSKIVAQVDAAITGGSRQWTAMQRWLSTQGVEISRNKLADHHRLGHVK